MTDNTPLPVKGYTGQSNDNVALANRLKEAEERYLRELDLLAAIPTLDQRMVALALVLKDPEPCEFIPCAGALGFFKWVYGKPEDVPWPARWMKPVPPTRAQPVETQGDLL